MNEKAKSYTLFLILNLGTDARIIDAVLLCGDGAAVVRSIYDTFM